MRWWVWLLIGIVGGVLGTFVAVYIWALRNIRIWE